MNNFQLVILLFISFVCGSSLTFTFFHRTKEKCEICDDLYNQLTNTWTGYFQLFTVVKTMFDNNISYESIKDTLDKTYEILLIAEKEFIDE